jgi:hypothetical protein
MKNASGKRSAPTGSIISGIAALKVQRQMHVDLTLLPESVEAKPITTAA